MSNSIVGTHLVSSVTSGYCKLVESLSFIHVFLMYILYFVYLAITACDEIKMNITECRDFFNVALPSDLITIRTDRFMAKMKYIDNFFCKLYS